MRRLIAVFVIISALSCQLLSSAFAQKNKLTWLTISEAEANLLSVKKPLLIDLYTDWCVWCKVMDKKTYTNKNVINYVQEKFYPVKVNAETRTAIKWKGQTFNFSQAYRVNEFAVQLTGGRLAFPTTVIVPDDGSMPQAIPGYLKPEDMEVILTYFAEHLDKKVSFEEYRKQVKTSWK